MGNQVSCLPDDPVTEKFTERGISVGQNIRFAVSGMQGLRSEMEDHHLYYTFIPVPGDVNFENTLRDHSVFAVFDGHGGDFTSRFLKENFMAVFAQQPEMTKYYAMEKTGEKSRADVNGVNCLKQALVGTFLALDRQILLLQKQRNEELRRAKGAPTSSVSSDSEEGDEESEPLSLKTECDSPAEERSGSTGIVVVVTPNHIICANLGDSRGLLRRNGNALPLSFDQIPTNLPERQRIMEARGTVKAKRVDGDLAVSRAFGDYSFKENASLAADKQKVIVVPELLVYPRIMDLDEFIILACDGIWDVASSNQCSQFVQVLLSEGETDLGNIAEEALDVCFDKKSRDNMTMMIIGLPGLNAESGATAALANAIWGQRNTRKVRLLRDQADKTTLEATIRASDFTANVFLRCVDEIGIEGMEGMEGMEDMEGMEGMEGIQV
jgi:serine/threonine protein phosphatase PrpC